MRRLLGHPTGKEKSTSSYKMDSRDARLYVVEQQVQTPRKWGMARHTMGIILLMCVVFLWTASNFLASVCFCPCPLPTWLMNKLGIDYPRRRQLLAPIFYHIHQHVVLRGISDKCDRATSFPHVVQRKIITSKVVEIFFHISRSTWDERAAFLCARDGTDAGRRRG